MKRRILLVDDEVAVLLTMKAILEISGFEVDTAASARDGKLKLRKSEYEMVITDMRMENDEAGTEVIRAAREAAYQPAIALLTAFPLADEDWQELGAHKMLIKPIHTRILLERIERLMNSHMSKRLTAHGVGEATTNAKPQRISAEMKATKTGAAKKKPDLVKPSKKASSKKSKKIVEKR